MSAYQLVKRALQSASGYGAVVRAKCPFCVIKGHSTNKKNLSFDKRNGKWFCYRCHSSGAIHGYQPAVEYAQRDNSINVYEPPLGWTSVMSHHPQAAKAREYAVKKRKLDLVSIAAAELGTVTLRERLPTQDQDWRNRLIVPIKSLTGEWLGYVGRDFSGRSELPYMYVRGMARGSFLYNQSALYTPSTSPVFVVEGTLDAVYLWPDAVALLGMWTDQQIEILCTTERPIVVLLDGDAWKKGEALADILRMYGKQAGSVRLGPKLDPDDMSRSWLRSEGMKCLGT